MAYTRGRCTNFDYCSIASSRRDVEVPVGDDFVCPECGKPLRPPQAAGEAGRNILLPAVLGGAVLVLVGGGIFLGMRLSGGSQPAPTPAPSRMAAAAPARQQTSAAPAASSETVLARVAAAPLFANGLAPALASAYMSQIGDTDVTTSAAGATLRVTGQRGDHRETILITASPAEAAFQAMGAHGADLAFTARRVTQGEQNSLTALGDMTSSAAEHLLGLGAIAIVVNPRNALPQIRRDQIAGVFGGTIHDWSGLGASASPLDAYGPPPSSDLPRLLGSLALSGAAPAAAVRVLQSPEAVGAAVTTDGRGIGYTDLAHIGQARAVPVAETGAAPVSAADRSAVAREDYPLTYRAYLYTPAQGGGIAQGFAQFALSPAGQAIVQKSGLVLQSERQAPAAPPPVTAQAGYKAFVAGARKIAITFHFNPNSTDLDLKGGRDLDRVINYVLSNHLNGDALILVGFADNQGDPATNLEVSKKRADAVAQLFIKRGMRPGKWGGFGSELEIADNATEDGREKNRRVEVYVKQ